PIEVDFRVVAATNRPLPQLIREGRFREDLYYRLNVVSFTMPSLKQRKEDIPLLAEHFLRRYTQETHRSIDKISREAIDEMMLYDWPGNVRELENAIERAVVVGKERQIQVADLPIACREPAAGPRRLTIEEVERGHIRQMLAENQWNIVRTARILGIDRSTLYHKIKRYQLRKDA
nr:sigma 54-interacting transcriptional regulator [Desulfobacterales bacterium]